MGDPDPEVTEPDAAERIIAALTGDGDPAARIIDSLR